MAEKRGRKKKAEKSPEAPTGSGKRKTVIDRDRRERMIAEVAYLRAAKRNFRGDRRLDDWLEAEREVDARLAKKPKATRKK